MSATFSTSPQLFQHFLGDFHPRKLLLLAPLSQPRSITSPPPPRNIQDPLNPNATGDESFNSNAIMVLIVLVCALLCSPGLHTFARCALRHSNLAGGNSSARLANKGIKQKALKTFPIVNYSLERSNLPGSDTECVICLSEFVIGDQVRILPKCSHGFHVRCIDKWLSSHSSCPTCRQCLMETCQKIAGASQASPSEQPPPLVQEITVSIAPLEREDIKEQLGRAWSCYLHHVLREGHQFADFLTKLGSSCMYPCNLLRWVYALFSLRISMLLCFLRP